VVLYDANKRLIAISNKTLELLGFGSLEEFRKHYYDIAQLFVKRPGYVHEFKSFHWIDYCLTNSTITHRAIIRTKEGREIEVFINISPLNGIEHAGYYLVTLEPNTYTECDTDLPQPQSEARPQTRPAPERPASDQKPPAAPAPAPQPRTIAIEPKEFPKPNLSQISEELNLDEEIIFDFIKEFINHTIEKLDEINEAIRKRDTQKLKNIIHTLRGVSANLRLKPAVDILSKSTRTTDLAELVEILKEFYSYVLFLARELEVPIEKKVELLDPASFQNAPATATSCLQEAMQEERIDQTKVQNASKELGLSFEEYQKYLKELINEIKINLAYNNYAELHKLASFARNLYLQECARYLDEVSVNQNPELVKKCLRDLEELKKEPNPFIVTVDDLKEALEIIQIDKKDFIEILEDMLIELKTLKSIKMKREKFLKKARQLKSLAESMRLNNLVLLLNNIITNYPLDKHLSHQFDEAIRSLEKALKEL